jgi:signal transduction histidine kinase
VGSLGLWGAGESLSEDCDWLIEASARILANCLRIEDLLQSDKLDALGEFAAGAGHEINNPVATISGRVQGLLQSETDLERRRQLLTIGSQALRIRDMIGDTMLFARPPQPHPELLDLQKVLPAMIEPLVAELKLANFCCELPEPVSLFADPTQLAVVITELLRNSLEWLDLAGGNILLSATSLETPAGRMARIVIEDDGESFLEEHLPHAFDPFFSGRQAGRGLGFGLPKCWRIVSNHHGRIGIAPLPDAGTRITVIWPAYDFLSSSPS